MPQFSHMTLPSSLWKESTVRFPLMERSFFVRSATSASTFFTSGWVGSTFAGFSVAR